MRGAATDRTAFRHQVHNRHFAAIEPVSREVEIRPETDLEPENVAVEVSRNFEIAGLDRGAER